MKKKKRKAGIELLVMKRDKSPLWVFQMHFITSHVVNDSSGTADHV